MTSVPGLAVMEGDSNPRGCEFKSDHKIIYGTFSHLFVVKLY